MTAWNMRFVRNCKQKKSERPAGPLITPETDKAVHWWVKRAQESNMGTEKFKQDQLSLNLQKNSEELYECRGRIQGSYPAYLPPNAVLYIREINTRCPRVNIARGSGPHHDLHKTRLLDTLPETLNKDGNSWLFWM